MRSPIIDELSKKKQIWIGTQYWTHRRLILGESTYGNEPSDTLGFAKHFETEEDFLFRTIYNAVTGTEGENPGRFQEQRRAFWASDAIHWYKTIVMRASLLTSMFDSLIFTEHAVCSV